MPQIDKLLTMFSGEIEQRNGKAVISIPDRELDLGELAVGESYGIAIRSQPNSGSGTTTDQATDQRQRATGPSEPPVAEGEQHEVEIEDTGDQGDGIARVGPGYIVFVPETTVGDRVTVEITQARENFAFGEVIGEEPVTG